MSTHRLYPVKFWVFTHKMKMPWQVSDCLHSLRRMAEPVWSTRLQTFLTVFNFHMYNVISTGQRNKKINGKKQSWSIVHTNESVLLVSNNGGRLKTVAGKRWLSSEPSQSVDRPRSSVMWPLTQYRHVDWSTTLVRISVAASGNRRHLVKHVVPLLPVGDIREAANKIGRSFITAGYYFITFARRSAVSRCRLAGRRPGRLELDGTRGGEGGGEVWVERGKLGDPPGSDKRSARASVDSSSPLSSTRASSVVVLN